MKSWQSLKSELLRNPEVRKAYEASEPEAALFNALINKRLEQGMNQAELAEMLGIREVSVSELKSLQKKPRASFLRKVARAVEMVMVG